MKKTEEKAPLEFRKSALESFSRSQYDYNIIRITNTKSWIALLTVFVLAAFFIFWGFWGSIITWVEGEGILLPEKGSIHNIVSPAGPSHIMKLYIRPQEILQKGDIVATMSRPALSKEAETTHKYLKTIRDNYQEQKSLSEKEITQRRETVEQQDQIMKQTLENEKKGLEEISALLEKRESSLKLKLITIQVYNDTLSKYYESKSKIDSLNERILQNQLDTNNFIGQWKQRLESLESKIVEEQHKLDTLEEQLKLSMEIRAPIDGIIIDIQKSEGEVVQEGDVVANITETGKGMNAVVYLIPQDGKKVKVNMDALVSPNTIKIEEYGSIQGTVKSVSPYPVTKESMIAVLRNKELVGKFAEKGAPIEVWLQLKADKKTFSKLKWSSSQGPEQLITPGTLVTSRITVREQSPFSMVIPALRKLINP